MPLLSVPATVSTIRRWRRLGAGLLWLLAVPAAAVETVAFRHLDSRAGLPQNSVTSIVQDREGYVWLGTHDGLQRYDGYQFQSYRSDPRVAGSLTDNMVLALLEDRDGQLWVGTQNGLNRFSPDRQQLTRYLPSDQPGAIGHRLINSLYRDPQQRVWIGTPRGVDRYEPETDSFVHYQHNPLDRDSIPSGFVNAFASAPDGKLWVGASTLALLDPSDDSVQHFPLTSRSGPVPQQITALWSDADGGLWAGTMATGLYYLPPNGKQFRHYRYDPHEPMSLPSNAVRELLRDRGGRLWIGTEGGGLARLLPDGSGFEVFRRNSADPHSISFDEIDALHEDRTGLLWIGTLGGGVNTTHPERSAIGRIIHSPYQPNSLADPFVWQLQRDADDKLWAATLSGLDHIDPRTGEVVHYVNFSDRDGSVFPPRIQAISVDRKRRLWLGSTTGELAVFDPATFRTEILTHPAMSRGKLSSYRIFLIDEDSKGRIWVGAGEGVIEIDPDRLEVLRSFPVNEEGFPRALVRVMEEVDGQLFFGTQGAGLQRLDYDSRAVRSFMHRDDDPTSLSNDVVRALYLEPNGDLWIGTQNGLNRWRASDRRAGVERFDSWFVADGLPNSVIYAIQPDNQGKLWLSTNAGLAEFDPVSNQFRRFDQSDGLPGNEFNSLAAVKTSDGRLWFGGTAGIAVVDPRALRSTTSAVGTLITGFDVRNPDDSRLRIDAGEWQLSANQNDVHLRFSALDYRDPHKNQFVWRLSGLQNDWISNGNRNELRLTNLDPGHYVFEVRNANADGIWSTNPAQLRFFIQAPWFARWYSYVGYAGLLLLAGWWLWHSHRRKVEAQQRINDQLRRIDQLKDEFLANTSHELRTPLNGIIGVAESLRDGVAGELNDRARDHLALIADSGRRLAHLVNEILDFKKLSHGSVTLERAPTDLQSSVAVVLALSRPLAGDKDLALVNAVPADFPPLDADENRLEQILHNLIGNAIKFTPQGHVTVTARVVDNMAEIQVADSGIGIAADQIERIFLPFEQVAEANTRRHGGTGLGLAVVKKLVDLHGGTVTVHSQEGSGSQFTFTLPLAAAGTQVKKARTETPTPGKLLPLRKPTPVPMLGNAATILVADDEPLNCQVVADCLAMQGYNVVTVGDGQAAIDALAEQNFSLLILDVMMPKLSGFDVARRVRETFSQQELPILMLSARNRPEDVATGLAAGANDYIGKPVERSELVARVKNLLALHEINAARREREQARVVQETVNRLARYFPPPLVQKLLADPDAKQLQAERRRLTVLFADLVEFTALTDRFEPEIITELLNQFLGGMGALVEKFGGTLNELLGDGLVVLFGAPELMDKEVQAERAVALAVAMQREMLRLQKSWLDAGIDHNINLRIGIHQDFATVGNFGSGQVLAYRAVGSGVNLAARLQQHCTPGRLLVSYPVYALTRERYPFEPLQEIVVKGFGHGHRVCELQPEKVTENRLKVISGERGDSGH
ncbi:MAG: two-component regulator propeller domain-containing protein [Pseudomonadota bacterium]